MLWNLHLMAESYRVAKRHGNERLFIARTRTRLLPLTRFVMRAIKKCGEAPRHSLMLFLIDQTDGAGGFNTAALARSPARQRQARRQTQQTDRASKCHASK
jgi:hypothetical protein